MLTDRHTQEIYTDRLRLIFLALPDVPEQWEDCDTELLRILYLIKNMENMTRESKPYRSGEYADFFEASSIGMLSDREVIAYSQSYLKDLDNQSALRFAEKKSLEEGRAKGRAEGRAEEHDKLLERARLSGLTEEQIRAIFG